MQAFVCMYKLSTACINCLGQLGKPPFVAEPGGSGKYIHPRAVLINESWGAGALACRFKYVSCMKASFRYIYVCLCVCVIIYFMYIDILTAYVCMKELVPLKQEL